MTLERPPAAGRDMETVQAEDLSESVVEIKASVVHILVGHSRYTAASDLACNPGASTKRLYVG
jgi:hypothetical protein